MSLNDLRQKIAEWKSSPSFSWNGTTQNFADIVSALLKEEIEVIESRLLELEKQKKAYEINPEDNSAIEVQCEIDGLRFVLGEKER